jgi:hypothetical protein
MRMTDLCEQFISFKIVDDPHRVLMTSATRPWFLTRYLYNKSEVEISFTKSLFDRKPDDALFWGYELYYSGLRTRCLKSYCVYTPHTIRTTTRCLKDIYAGLRRNGGISGFARTYGGLIVNLAF